MSRNKIINRINLRSDTVVGNIRERIWNDGYYVNVFSRKGGQHASLDGESQQSDGKCKKENNRNARNE